MNKEQKDFINVRLQEAKTTLMKAHSLMFEVVSYVNSFVVQE